MSYFINPVEAEQCVFLTFEGEMPPIEVVGVRYETTGLLAALHWNRMVVDFTGLRSLTALELFVFAKGLSSDLPPSARVALVVPPEQASHAKRVENIIRNDGVFLTSFIDVEEATNWAKGINLRERKKPQPVVNPVKR